MLVKSSIFNNNNMLFGTDSIIADNIAIEKNTFIGIAYIFKIQYS